MLSNKRNIIMIVLVIIVIILMVILFLKTKEKPVNAEINNNNQFIVNNMQKNTIGLSESKKEEVINELYDKMSDKIDDGVSVIINGESITKKEIALIDFQMNNKYLNKEKKDPTKEAIRQYVICQNANKNGINLSDKEKEEIKNRNVKYMERDVEQTNEIMRALNMNKEECLQFLINREEKIQTVSKWNMNVNELIDEGKTENMNDEQFKKKYNEYKSSNEIAKKYKLLNELVELYENYLIEQATIEYVK